MLWLNAYCTSSDPRVIGGYYLDTVRELGGTARIIRTDLGTENCTVRNIQLYLRHSDDDPQAGGRSFIYGHSTSNQRIESWWGFLRKECVEFWLEHFHHLKDYGNFDGGFLDKNLILFCFLGLIQDELDLVKDTWNSHLIRPSRNDLVPHGRPHVMYTLPELYGTEDYLCHVPEIECTTCEDQCTHRCDVPCDKDVFTICTHVMAQHHLSVPADVYGALDLYLSLRQELTTMLNLADRVQA
ncbi:uncharacterized protein LOC143486114 [Brachyhypopomus gauderio]|uniref:uncharacterized protein LOC143486114 n=1 Tax=Brachyhypopomus gauderio TaxID=698409 RepID=UPI00404180CB